MTPAIEAQTSSRVLLVRPARFWANPETAATNAFQRPGVLASDELLARARREFDGLVATLRAHDVDVWVVEDTPVPAKPDAIFPNNWISFHADGTVVLYPLLAPSRRAEVRPELVDELVARGLPAPRRVLDLRAGAGAEVLEGTGSLVLDRVASVAYACLSPRTSPGLLGRFARELGYRVLAFHATDARGLPIYHTNVMMAVGTRCALACLEAIDDARERAEVERELARTHEVVPLTRAQLDDFAGNALELRTRSGEPLWALSARARGALWPEQRAALERGARLVSAELGTIEHHGGGSARCMLAEVFAPG
jgi:hypothetical protein